MTTEEKARAYDEMVQRVKELHEAGNALTRKQMKIVLPELAESEDERIERIRKWIKKEIEDKYVEDGIVNSKLADDALGWLEKQKEPHYTKRNALFDKCVENCDPEVMKRVSDEIDAKLQKEQNPEEWSDEDYNALKYIHELISFGYTEKFFNAQTADDMMTWLNSHITLWKPSEERMKALNEVINTLAASKNPHESDYLFNMLNGLRKDIKNL